MGCYTGPAKARIVTIMLVLGVAAAMALAMPALMRVIVGRPDELPGSLNLLLAGMFPSWQLVGQLEARRRSQRGLAVFTSAGLGIVCVVLTLLTSIALEGSMMLLLYGEMRVRFEYTALIPFLWTFVATAPIGILVGVLIELVVHLVVGAEVDAGVPRTT